VNFASKKEVENEQTTTRQLFMISNNNQQPVCSGVASMQQMEQLFSPDCQGPLQY